MSFTERMLGSRPRVSDLTIDSSRVRSGSPVFTLTPNMCDCSAIIGAAPRSRVDAYEIPAEGWLAWLHELPGHVPHLNRAAVLHTWSPQEDAVVPAHAKGVRIEEVTEQTLRGIGEDSLLTIDYPR